MQLDYFLAWCTKMLPSRMVFAIILHPRKWELLLFKYEIYWDACTRVFKIIPKANRKYDDEKIINLFCYT